MQPNEQAQNIWRGMRMIIELNDRRAEVAAALGVSYSRVKALRHLSRAPISLHELADRMVIDAPRATTIVNDLVGRGLVDRQPDAADRRRKIVVVTPEGMQLARTAQGIMDIPPAAIAELSFDDLGELDRIIGLVVRKLRSGGSRATQ